MQPLHWRRLPAELLDGQGVRGRGRPRDSGAVGRLFRERIRGELVDVEVDKILSTEVEIRLEKEGLEGDGRITFTVIGARFRLFAGKRTQMKREAMAVRKP